MIIRHLDELPALPVSHNPHIFKKVFLPQGEIPNVCQFAQATLASGDVVNGHLHPDMWEVFLVVSGNGNMTICGKNINLNPGTSVTVEPNESHKLENTGSSPLVLTYFGITALPTADD